MAGTSRAKETSTDPAIVGIIKRLEKVIFIKTNSENKFSIQYVKSKLPQVQNISICKLQIQK